MNFQEAVNLFKTEVGNDRDAAICLLEMANIVREMKGTTYLHAIAKRMGTDKYKQKNADKTELLWFYCLQSAGVENLEELPNKSAKSLLREVFAKVSAKYDFIEPTKAAEIVGMCYPSFWRLKCKGGTNNLTTQLIEKAKVNFDKHYAN